MQDTLFAELKSLVYESTKFNCPRLSGNMHSHIKLMSSTGDEMVLCIAAPYYDLNKWKRTGRIEYTGAVINGKTDYAELVNRLGAFGRNRKSKHWLNIAIYKACRVLAANHEEVEVINELEL